MNFEQIDKRLKFIEDSIGYTCFDLYTRDAANKQLKIKVISRAKIKKLIKKYRHTERKSPLIKRIFAVCHPNEFHFALGLCKSCYEKDYRKKHPKPKNIKPIKYSKCHPDNKYYALDKCYKCYFKYSERKEREKLKKEK